MTVAVLQFPGSNCEQESIDALRRLNIPYQLVEWNSTQSLDPFNGFLLPGGFSYQDRIRAGVIAAKCSLIEQLKLPSNCEKPILGICNGAQILAESGLLSSGHQLDHMIDHNIVEDCPIGFVCDWGFLTPFNPSHNVFLSSLSDGDVLPIQICHGEGRFLFSTPPMSGLKYTDIHGECSEMSPITPNGSTNGIAALSNDLGNILAIMPHPERSLMPSRYPLSIQVQAKKNNQRLVNFSALFQGFKGTPS